MPGSAAEFEAGVFGVATAEECVLMVDQWELFELLVETFRVLLPEDTRAVMMEVADVTVVGLVL